MHQFLNSSEAGEGPGYSVYRDSGIDIIGFVPWGTHFCAFYKDEDDLADILAGYFAAGLRNNEFCMCVTSGPQSAEGLVKRMKKAIPRLDDFIERRQIEIIPYDEWYLIDGVFDEKRVLDGWVEKLNDALARGYSGLRLSGNTFWLERTLWKSFMDYEQEINDTIGRYRMIALCTYSLDRCGAGEIIDVANTHQYAMVRKEGEWKLIENIDLRETRKALKEAVAQAEMYLDLISHDINNMSQVAMNSLELTLESMDRDGRLRPEDKKLLEMALGSLRDITRLVDSIHALQRLKEAGIKSEPVDLNGIVQGIKKEFFEAGRNNVTISYRLPPRCLVMANGLVKDMLSNLIGNSIKHSDPDRPLAINVYVERVVEGSRPFYRCVVEDDGPGIPDELKARLFSRFLRGNTRSGGKGLGLYLVRTLAESLGGRVWVEDRVPGDYTKGARLVFTLPAAED